MTRTLKGFLLKSFQNVFNKIVKQQNSDCTQLQDGTFFAASPSSSSTSVISVIIICSRTRSFYIRNKEKLNEKQCVVLIKDFYLIIHTNSFDFYNAYLKLGTVGLIEQVHRKLGLHSFELLQNIQYMALLIGELSHGLPRYLSK